MAEFKFDIVENIGVLSENAKGWRKELNFVSWNEREPKYDIREWDPEHNRMAKMTAKRPTRRTTPIRA